MNIQTDLEGKEIKPPAILETGEDKHYNIFAGEFFRVRLSDEALEKLLELKENETPIDRAYRVKRWVYKNMRFYCDSGLVPPGAYEIEADAIYDSLTGGGTNGEDHDGDDADDDPDVSP